MIEIDTKIDSQEIKVITKEGAVVYGVITDSAREDFGTGRVPPFSWPKQNKFRDGFGFSSTEVWVKFIKHRLDGPALINSDDEYWFYKGYIVGRKSLGYTQEQFEKELLEFKMTLIIET
jgi:hypothetical protein